MSELPWNSRAIVGENAVGWKGQTKTPCSPLWRGGGRLHALWQIGETLAFLGSHLQKSTVARICSNLPITEQEGFEVD